MSDATTATEPAPPPAPPHVPLLTPESFEGLVRVVEALAALADATQEGARIPIEPQLEQDLSRAVTILVAVDRQGDKLSEPALHAWAARASALAALCGDLTVKLLADLTDRALAKPAAIVAPNGDAAAAVVAERSQLVDLAGRPMTAPPRPTLPPHLQAVIAAHHAPPPLIPVPRDEPGPAETTDDGKPVHLVTFDPLYDRTVRVTCKTCNIALGEVGDDVAETVAKTHLREKHGAAGDEVKWLHPDVPDPTGGPYDVPTCRRCGCTDGNACQLLGPDGKSTIGTCSWREINPETNAGVCTACAE